MRIVVAGLAATYPLGGVFWDYMQYPQGFADLGHDVLYLEDTGMWCYDPAISTMVESGKHAATWLRGQIEQFLPSLTNRWFYRDATGDTFGIPPSRAQEFCRTAELFLDVSGAAFLRGCELPRARTIYLDSDPMYSQAAVPDAIAGNLDLQARDRISRMQAYDLTLTFGENIGEPNCLIPDQLFQWQPTRQPILVEAMTPYRVHQRERTRTFTTVGSWDSYKQPIVVDGRRYFGKRHEFQRFRRLPEMSGRSFQLALSGDGPTKAFAASGWSFSDPSSVSASAGSYLRFLASSFAEWSVAKHAYVASNSGWFSGRTALYLALGVPAIVQDTGFSSFLPTGCGLHAFSTVEEALAAIEDVAVDYERNCDAALAIAHEYFDAKKVLSKLLDDAFSSSAQVDEATHSGPLT